jgi:hypothetical protein
MIKDSLIQNINVLRFLNLFETFETTLLVWGSNEAYHFGLCLKRELSKYYQSLVSDGADIKA